MLTVHLITIFVNKLSAERVVRRFTCIPHVHLHRVTYTRGRIDTGHLHRVTYARGRIDTIDSPDDEYLFARNM